MARRQRASSLRLLPKLRCRATSGANGEVSCATASRSRHHSGSPSLHSGGEYHGLACEAGATATDRVSRDGHVSVDQDVLAAASAKDRAALLQRLERFADRATPGGGEFGKDGLT